MSRSTEAVVGIASPGILRLPFLSALLAAVPCRLPRFLPALLPAPDYAAVAGWGRRPTALRARAHAERRGLPFIALEDGFLRSFAPGERFPPLSLVSDAEGIYYDSTRPSALETLLASPADLLAGRADEVARARRAIAEHGLSKYNHAPALRPGDLRAGDTARILVVDQTAGDMSVALGGADAGTFAAMLAAARLEHPGATIYVKTHPETSAGRKGGYLTGIADDERTVVLRRPVEPAGLIRAMDRVYVVTSGMGFEALLAGKPVTCFGLPWYAGWGATDDRQHCPRRTRRRSVDELFAAAYLRYASYLDPETRGRGDIFAAIDFLVRQRRTAARYAGPGGAGRLLCVGFRRWKAANVAPLLEPLASGVFFAADAAAARRLTPRADDRLLFWGATPPPGLAALAEESGARLLRMEDGFVRSVGLGSDFIRPLSLVLDGQGSHFDPRQPSDLEALLAGAEFSADELARARRVREFIVAHGITKYNLEARAPAEWASGGRAVLLVPGQVEDDASLRWGCTEVRGNLALLAAARRARPDAFIVYKPHPDVASGNRTGRLALARAREYADHVETRLSVVSCIEACDEVHTLTSQTGFDALLRGKRVVTYGQPFYAGWGLTEDRAGETAAFARRRRRLSIDELVAGALLRYPLYWDRELNGYASCEAVLRRIVEERDALEANGGLDKLCRGRLRRQWRKLAVMLRAWAGRR